jgi:hypothetical protein
MKASSTTSNAVSTARNARGATSRPVGLSGLTTTTMSAPDASTMSGTTATS